MQGHPLTVGSFPAIENSFVRDLCTRLKPERMPRSGRATPLATDRNLPCGPARAAAPGRPALVSRCERRCTPACRSCPSQRRAVPPAWWLTRAGWKRKPPTHWFGLACCGAAQVV